MLKSFPKLFGLACLGVGLSIFLGTLFYLDEHFANHLGSWLPELVFTRFCLAAMLVGFGLNSLRRGDLSVITNRTSR